MLKIAQTEDALQLATVKEGFDLAEVHSRFHWLQQVNVSWLVWWEKQKSIGWALIQWSGKPTAPHYPDIFDLYVHPQWRGQGVGTQILKACEQVVSAAGYEKVGLAVNPDHNYQAYRLYQRLGYIVSNPEKYIDGVYNGVEDWVIDLEKCLAGNK